MATPTNLFQFYTSKGQKLPSIQDRSKLYEQYGLGPAGTYGGTYEQNVSLLGKLQSPTPTTISPTPVINPPVAPSPNVPQQITQTQQEIDRLKAMAERVGQAGPGADINPITQEITYPNVSAPSPQSFTPPATPPATPVGTTEPITGNVTLDALLERMKAWETPEDVYKKLRVDLGLEAKEAGVAGIQTQVQKTEELLTNLEKDISTRMSGTGMIEAQGRRMLAVEGAPLREQYAQLVRGQGLAESGLTSARQQLADLYSAQTKTTPYQDLLKTITETQAKEVISPTKIKELSISEKYGTGAIGEYNFYAEQEKTAGRTPLTFDAYQTMDANRKAKITAAANASGLDWKTTNYIEGISKAFDSSPIVKQFNEIQNKYISISDIIDKSSGGPADLALVFEFMKSLDPTSVVRESEYDVAAKSGNPMKQVAAKIGGYFSNGKFLPEEVKAEFRKITGIKYNAIQKQYNNLRSEKARQINLNTGVPNAENYLVNYNYDLGLGKEKETYTIEDVKDDILNMAEKYNYNFGREQMIEDLFALYSPYGITKQQIIDQVYPITNQLWGKK